MRTCGWHARNVCGMILTRHMMCCVAPPLKRWILIGNHVFFLTFRSHTDLTCMSESCEMAPWNSGASTLSCFWCSANSCLSLFDTVSWFDVVPVCGVRKRVINLGAPSREQLACHIMAHLHLLLKILYHFLVHRNVGGFIALKHVSPARIHQWHTLLVSQWQREAVRRFATVSKIRN
jgi:hypothetical protein